VLADAPRGYWRLGEASGTSASDASGFGANGTLTGGVVLGAPGALSSDFDTAARFDGTNDLVSMGDPSSGTLDFGTTDFSVELSVKTTTNGERTLVGKRSSGPGWLLTVTDDPGRAGTVRALLADGSVTRQAYSSVRVDEGAWHHLVVVFDRETGIRFFVDGADAGFTPGPSAGSVGNAVAFQLGKASGYGYFRGDLDEVAVYALALTAERVQAHFAAR
jgi:hypothetical protein